MGKRAAAVAASAGSPVKKGRKNVIQPKVSAVVEALDNESLETDVPMGARRMLALGATAALSSPVEERHQLQDVMLGHIREVLSSMAEKLKAAVAVKKAATDERDGELSGLKEKLDAAQAALDEAETVVKGQAEKLAAGQEAVKAAAAEVKTAESGMKTVTRERAVQDKDRSKYTVIQEGNFKLLLEGSIEGEKEMLKASTKLVKDLEKIGAEPAMMASLPQVLLKKPDDRKGFDGMVVDSVKAILDKAVAEVDAKIATIDAKTAEIQQEVTAKAEALEAATSASEACAKVLADAKAEASAKNDAKDEAQKVVDACASAVAELREAQSAAEAAESTFGDVQKDLDFLAAYSLAVPEEPAAPEAPAEAAPTA